MVAMTSGVLTHELPRAYFDQLSHGAGDPDVVRALWRTHRSRRLLLINAFLDEAARRPDLLGELPPAAEAWAVLSTAEAVDADIVDTVVMHPQVGTWVAYAMRRLRGAGISADAEPMWLDFGQIHALALAAAARTGLAWRGRVPLRCGRVVLPTLGLARFDDVPPWAVADASVDAGRITLRHGADEVDVDVDAEADGPGWWRLRRIRTGTSPVLAVFLDDLDPFRNFADPIPPTRLDEAELERWRSLVEDGWALLCADHPEVAEAMAVGVVSLVPLPADGVATRSGSTGEAFGMVMSSLPPDPAQMAETLVHEFHHIKLGGLTHLVQLTDDDPTATYYAPWRDDPRPLGGFLQGIYAFVAIAGFWRTHRMQLSGPRRRLADFEYALARGRSSEALAGVCGSAHLTPAGSAFIDGLVDRVRPWQDEPLSDEVVTLADLVRDSHRSGWRIRNVHPHRDDIRALADAWLAEQPAPPGYRASVVEEAPEMHWSLGRHGLARMRMESPDSWRDTATRTVGADWASDLDTADVDLVAGDRAAATAGFLARIRADQDDAGAWTGLALVGSARVWSQHPELVRAVYVECGSRGSTADPLALAAWIDGVRTEIPMGGEHDHGTCE
jgi:HEXXH motif-containing protein